MKMLVRTSVQDNLLRLSELERAIHRAKMAQHPNNIVVIVPRLLDTIPIQSRTIISKIVYPKIAKAKFDFGFLLIK